MGDPRSRVPSNECRIRKRCGSTPRANLGFNLFTLWQHPLCYSSSPGDILMASSVPSAQDPYADRRVYPRVPVALPAFLQANGARHHVQILDLSAGGAKLNCAVCLSSGTAVVLDCGTLGGPAVVRWQNGGLLGLCFDSELDAQEISALIDRSKALASRMKISD